MYKVDVSNTYNCRRVREPCLTILVGDIHLASNIFKIKFTMSFYRSPIICRKFPQGTLQTPFSLSKQMSYRICEFLLAYTVSIKHRWSSFFPIFFCFWLREEGVPIHLTLKNWITILGTSLAHIDFHSQNSILRQFTLKFCKLTVPLDLVVLPKRKAYHQLVDCSRDDCKKQKYRLGKF